VRPHVVALQSRIRDAKKVESDRLMRLAEQVIADMSSWRHQAFLLGACQEELSLAQRYASTETYFGFLDSIALLEPLTVKLPPLRTKRIDELRLQIERMIQSAREALLHTDTSSRAVESALIEVNTLLDQASQNLGTVTYESFDSALSLAQSATGKAWSARQLARKNARRRTAVLWGTSIGLILGIVVGALATAPSPNSPFEFQAVSIGALLGGIAGALLGVVAGYTIEQNLPAP